MRPPHPWYRKPWILWTGLVVLLVLGWIVLAIVRDNDSKAAAAKLAQAKAKPSVSATVATFAKGNIGVYLEAIGTVTPVYTALIVPQASGILTAVHYGQGQFVHKGTR